MNTVAFMDTKLNDTACNLSCHTIVGSFDLPLNSRLMFRNEKNYNNGNSNNKEKDYCREQHIIVEDYLKYSFRFHHFFILRLQISHFIRAYWCFKLLSD